jgi:hypothetical protein
VPPIHEAGHAMPAAQSLVEASERGFAASGRSREIIRSALSMASPSHARPFSFLRARAFRDSRPGRVGAPFGARNGGNVSRAWRGW